MQCFIKEQLNLYHDKYTYHDFNKIKKPTVIIIQIKNNEIIHKDIKHIDNASIKLNDRYVSIIKILQLLVSKYKLNDTILAINHLDGYDYDYDLPIFNFAVPLGKKGLIFLNMDLLNFYYKKNTFYTFNEVKQLITEYSPPTIINDIYFKGNNVTIRKSKIREQLMTAIKPFNIVTIKDFSEEIPNLKNHKYLIDLPGYKPWSVRLKYLLLMGRPIIRVSFYNSKFNELSHWRQYYDCYFKENEDYIHLKYDIDYDVKLTPSKYKEIKKDIIQIYHTLEKNPSLYKKIVSNCNLKKKYLSIDNALKYLYLLIQEYTDKLIKK